MLLLLLLLSSFFVSIFLFHCQFTLLFYRGTGGRIFSCIYFRENINIEKSCNFIEKEASLQMFSSEFCEIFLSRLLAEHLCVAIDIF